MADTTFDGVDLQALAQRIGTPCHVYSATAIRQRIHALTTALHGLDAQVCYAVKANSNLAILQLMADAGFGADIVSAGEMLRAVCAGIPAQRIVFSGVGKSADEIAQALDAGIARFNVESADELHLLQRIAAQHDVIAHAAARINPDVDAGTHAKISTGKSENKFGVEIDEARRWFADSAQLTHLRLDGLHVHIGSQMLSLGPIRAALQRAATFRRELEADGHPIRSIDVGGGLGVCYRDGHDTPVAIADYVDVIRRELDGFDGRILLEPGRWLVAEAGLLLTRVIRVKHGVQRKFLIVDAAMNDLVRPSLYDARLRATGAELRRAAALRCGRACVREQGHLRARSRVAAVHRRRSADDQGHWRVWCIDGIDVQFAAARRRSAGRQRPLRRGAAAPEHS